MKSLYIFLALFATSAYAEEVSEPPTVTLTASDIEAFRNYARAEGAANYAVGLALEKARPTINKINEAFKSVKR